MKGDTYLAIY